MPQKTKLQVLMARTKKFVKNNKKTIKISIISIITIIFLISTSYLINVNIKLLFDTETHITVTPSITSITTKDKTPPTINFTTNIQKLPTCDVICTGTLIDTSHNQTINKTTITETKTTSYNIPLPRTGTGQLLINYQVSCKTTQKKLCPSKNKTYTKTSFVTVNYGLSNEEEEQKIIAQQQLTQLTQQRSTIETQAKTLTEQQQQAQQTINYSSNNQRMQNGLSIIKRTEKEIISQWQTQNYKATINKNEEFKQQLAATQQEILFLNNTLQATIKTYNEQNKALQRIHEQKNNLSNWTRLLSLQPTTLQKLKQAATQYNNTINNKTTLEQRNKTLKNITKIINESKKVYEELLQKQEIKANNLTNKYKQILQHHNLSWYNISCETITPTSNQLQLINANTTQLQEYNNTYCNLTTTTVFINQPTNITLNNTAQKMPPTNIPEPQPTCCYKNNCNNCNENHTPIILVHGHSFSKATSPELAFTRLTYLQEALAKEGYIHGSTLNKEAAIDNVPTNEWQGLPAPIVIGVTYYYLNYYDLGQLSFTTRKTDRIENYALRLRESIQTIQGKTGQEEIIIIAHSMGGLVVREYMRLFGDEHVEQVIILGTPNKGIEGDIKKYCTVTGATEECNDMAANSAFLQTLNKYQPRNTNITTIRAQGCLMKNDIGEKEQGDGVVLARNVPLKYANNYLINGSCEDLFNTELHMNFVNPTLHPETYELIKITLNKE